MSLFACTQGGVELDDDVAIDTELAAELDVDLDLDRAAAVELLAEHPRCWNEAGKPRQAWELSDPQGDPETGLLAVRQGDKLLALPLQHARFDTVVVGTVAETEITQIFANPFEQPIEAVYMFPLHERAAVDDYWLTVGQRSIRGQMQTREQARETYEQAKQSGRTAGLLEQQRPNVFTQQVANILPGERIEVSLHVVQPLEQEHGVFSLVLPTVVGPRYVPSTVTDAPQITAPSIPEGYTTCADLDVSVVIESGLRPQSLRSKFHAIDIRRQQDVAVIELDRNAGPVVANRDFVLSWALGQAQPQAAIVAQPTHDGGYFTLTVQPPELVPDEQAVPRELVFVVDNSGSMDGMPIDTAKALMRRALAGLRPDDTFAVLRFSDHASGLSTELLPASEHNIAKGLEFIAAMRGEGGTDMTQGIHAALELPRARERMRLVLFLTDGYVGNEADIFALIERELGDARLFALGVGNAHNRYLLDGMAQLGRGAVTYADESAAIDGVVGRFYERIETPMLTDLEIDWQGLAVDEVLPGKLPDLFAGQPLTVFGRYQGTPSGSIVVRGHARGELIEIPVRFELAEAEDLSGVSSIWARNKIDALLGYPNLLGSGTSKRAVTELALQHRILTQFTSFVAVEEHHVVNPDGTPRTIVQALPLPDGTTHEHFSNGLYKLGGHGLLGGGGTDNGYGRGSGCSVGCRGKRVPQIRLAKHTVTGSLDKDMVRRIGRAHINEVRSCYNATLTNDPKVAGRVTIELTIKHSGKVDRAVVHSNDTGNATLGTCIAKAAERWSFPKIHDGGEVVITYPFVLRPG